MIDNNDNMYSNTMWNFPKEWSRFDRLMMIGTYLVYHTSPKMEKTFFEQRIELIKCYILLLKIEVMKIERH